MGPIDLLWHLLSFAAPALAVGVAVACAARVLMPARGAGRAWWLQAAINSIAGLLVLAAGLWYFGVDGKMATYAALAVAIATVQWLAGVGRKA